MELLKNFVDKNTAVLIFNPVARQYLTGFPSSLGYLFITLRETVLFVDGRYIEAAKHSVKEGIKVLEFKNLKEDVKPFLKDVKKIIAESENKVSEIERFEKCFEIPVAADSKLDKIIADKRLSKTRFEIECIKKAQAITETAFDFILGFIKPGVTEKQIAAELEYRMKLAGSENPSFSTIAISGEKTSMPHGVPGERAVKSGEFVTMDFGAIWGGYHSDMTRTVAVGNVSNEMKRVYEVVLAANEKGISAIKEGIFCNLVDKAARDVIADAGYGDYFTHSTGHGVGLEIHEAPNLGTKCDTPLTAGQVVTVEPGIYLPSKFGVRIEDMVVVTKNGCNNLTKAEKKFIII